MTKNIRRHNSSCGRHNLKRDDRQVAWPVTIHGCKEIFFLERTHVKLGSFWMKKKKQKTYKVKLCGLIIQVSVVLRRTVVSNGDWHFDNLSRSHYQSQVNSCCQSPDSDNEFCLDFQHVSYHNWQQSFSGVHLPGWLNYTITCYFQVQTIYRNI